MPRLLKKYREKRDFEATPEPSGEARVKAGLLPRFVIQKHDASRLHYDFRLEAEGVLKSWAVPKGLSSRSGEKRLAVMTEDHPLDYADFEGMIPEGHYGAGPVIVWDRGIYLNLTQRSGRFVPVPDAIERGHLVVWLHGQKVNGIYSLNRFENRKKEWIASRGRNQAVKTLALPETKKKKVAPEASVLTGRTLEDILNGKAGRRTP